MRNLITLIISLAMLSASGCVSNNPGLKRVTVTEKELILSGDDMQFGTVLTGPLPEEDIFGLSGEMKQFVDDAVSGINSEDRRIRALLDSIFSKEHLGIKFDEKATYTAREAFTQRRANCLSFTTLIVPMLRYVGIKVEFNEVDVPPVWDLQQNNMMILYEHVNAIITKSSGKREVLDINLDEYELHYPQRNIDDRIVEAQYYNNRGMEYLLAGNNLEAFRYMRKAIELAPDLPFVWTNLGTLYRSLGKLEYAEIAYRVALEIDQDNLVAISNAQRNYRDLNNKAMSTQLSRQALYFRNKNPYYRYSLARDAVLTGDYETALKHINAAIRLYKKEHRFFFLQGIIYEALAEQTNAEASFKKALELTSGQKQRDIYLRKMEQLI